MDGATIIAGPALPSIVLSNMSTCAPESIRIATIPVPDRHKLSVSHKLFVDIEGSVEVAVHGHHGNRPPTRGSCCSWSEFQSANN